MKKEIMGWQWHQLDHMQIICTLQQTDTSLVTQFFTHWMLFLTSNQHYESTEGNKMVIYWFVNMSFKPQGCGYYSTNCCYLFTAFGRV